MFYRLADPQYLLLLLTLPLLALWYWRRRRGRYGSLRYSSFNLLRRTSASNRARLRHSLVALRILGLALLILALSRPQSGVTGQEIRTEGIDILLAMNLSSSMLAEDLEPNRVEAAKMVAADFIRGRRNDRIGLVVFSGLAYTQCPLTLDYDVVLELLREMEVGLIEDGTAIGMGLATAVKRLRDSQAQSKVIILLTDGRNNQGEIDPLTAAQMAQAFSIKVYAIGAGTRGEARYPIRDPLQGMRYVRMRVDIDEDTLEKIADLTGGRYFRATDRQSLQSIYQEIDALEKTEIEVEEYTRYGELFHIPLALGSLLILSEVALALTRFRSIP